MIHATAHISPTARIADDAEIGPNVTVGDHAVVGSGTKVMANAVIGDGNLIREYATIHRGNRTGTTTTIGNNNFFMIQSHVAHNCEVGNNIILAGGALLAGHVIVEDRAIISGNCVVHQFCRIGRFAMMRGLSRTSRDVPPFCIMDETHTVKSLNLVGLRRNGFDVKRVRALKNAFLILFRSGLNMQNALEQVESDLDMTDDIRELLDFIKNSKRGVCFGEGTSVAEFE